MIYNTWIRMATILLIFFAAGCVSNRFVLDPKWENRRPDYEDYVDQYLLGMVGNIPPLDLSSICMEGRPQAAEVWRSYEDGLITFWTMGIYSPRTIRVWCAK